MNNDKIVLKDGTEINLESALGIGALNVRAESKEAIIPLWGKFSKDNLKHIQVKNSGNVTVGNYQDMVLDHIEIRENADGSAQVRFCLRGKTTEELLTERIEALESGQQTQDEAIGDLGQAVSDIAEGGTQ